MNYYVIHTNEDKEYLVKNQITNLFPELTVKIPIKRSRIDVAGRDYYVFERILPEYVIVSCKKLSPVMVRKIKSIYDVESFPTERIEKEEIDRFIKNINTEMVLATLKDYVVVIQGEYAGNMCVVNGIDNDLVSLTINRLKKTIQLPIWFLGKEIV